MSERAAELKLSYSRHAKDRLRERKISRQEVEYCLEHYSESYPDRQGNRIYVGKVGKRRIKVVVSRDDANFVITVAD